MPSSSHVKKVELTGNPSYPSWTTDARERLISNTQPDPGSRSGHIFPHTVICVEPAPGVAASVAGSLGGGISVFHYGSGSLSAAAAEQLIQTEERTVAIQALLNAGYQNCLDYSNGAINGTIYAIRAKSLDDLLVTIVAVDEAAGNYGRTLGAASSGAKSTGKATLSGPSAADIQQSAQELGAANRKVKADERDLAQKRATLDKATTQAQASKAAAAADANNTAKQAQASNDANAQATAQSDVDATDKKLQSDQDTRDGMLAQLNSTADTAASAEASGAVIAAGGFTGRPSDSVARSIADMQARFLERNSVGQYITACLAEEAETAALTPDDATKLDKAATDYQSRGGSDPSVPLDSFAFRSEFTRQSELHSFCKRELGKMLMRSEDQEADSEKMRLDTERLKADAQFLAAVDIAEKSCESLTG